jgi:hypothetical protein
MLGGRFSGWSGGVRRRPARALVVAMLLASLVATLAVTGQVLAGGAGSGCADTHSCMWGSPNYENQKATLEDNDCCDWKTVIIGQGVASAKNRFNNRNFKLRFDSSDNVHCLDPGDNRPSPGWSGVDMAKVGEIGSRC